MQIIEEENIINLNEKKDNNLSYNSLNINIVAFHHEKNNERLKYKKITILIKIKYICL